MLHAGVDGWFRKKAPPLSLRARENLKQAPLLTGRKSSEGQRGAMAAIRRRATRESGRWLVAGAASASSLACTDRQGTWLKATESAPFPSGNEGKSGRHDVADDAHRLLFWSFCLDGPCLAANAQRWRKLISMRAAGDGPTE